MAWSDGLAGSSLEFAQAQEQYLRGLAGPGTGKTFALMRRVARLLEEGADPERILVVTFTRMAAEDLKRQLKDLKLVGCDQVKASTLHGLCFGILSKQEVLQLTGRVPRPLLTFETKGFLLNDLPESLGKKRAREERLRAFEAAWARLQSEKPGWAAEGTDRSFREELTSWLRFHQAMLIGEIIPETLAYLRDNPSCGERRAFDVVLVDEYQDLNKAEQVLVDLLAEGKPISIIGDDAQSIYSFKFANPEGILEFPNTHFGTKDVLFPESRRCPEKIIGMANALISHLDPRRQLKSTPGGPVGEAWIVQWPTFEEEARGIASIIHTFIRNNQVVPGEVLVLTPRRVIGYAIRDALKGLGVDAHSFFPEEALGTSLAQERFTLLSLLADPNDRVSLRCWLGFGDRFRRRDAYRCLRGHCMKSGLGLWEALEQLEVGRIAIPSSAGIVERFRILKAELAELQTLEIREIADKLFPEGTKETEGLRQLTLESLDGCPDAKAFYEDLRTRITQPEPPREAAWVRIMSLHKAKGLTAKFVVIAGCIHGFVPTWERNVSQAEQEQQLKEQRRLFYVALTRSKQYLIISSFLEMALAEAHRMGAPIRRYRGPARGLTIASRILGELGSSAPRSIRGEELLRISEGFKQEPLPAVLSDAK